MISKLVYNTSRPLSIVFPTDGEIPALALVGNTKTRKTFTLNLLWRALTSSWASLVLSPGEPTAKLEVTLKSGDVFSTRFHKGDWSKSKSRNASCSVVYLRDDGISAYDAWRASLKGTEPGGSYRFDHDTIFHTTALCSGLLFDLCYWSYDETLRDEVSATINAVTTDCYKGLSKSHTRLDLYDARSIPMLLTNLGEESVLHLPRSVRRVLSLIYLLYWMRERRQQLSEFTKTAPDPNETLVLLLDGLTDLNWSEQDYLLRNLASLQGVLGIPMQVVLAVRCGLHTVDHKVFLG